MIEQSNNGRPSETGGLRGAGAAAPVSGRHGEDAASASGDPENRGLGTVAVLGYN